MAAGIRFAGEFEAASLAALVPGHWYIGVACVRCGGHFAIMNEPSGTGNLEISGDALFDAACPNCGESAKYRVTDLVTFQAAQGGPISTT
ncbi:hypothetical protein ACNHKD_03370 [Methylocystis sp. JAN1]|uniref:hypothetical protein n=1 Tax=Methylocystis sp. JAN1 TaxID=3397211 RepID=UPI003FA25400